ncbi:MAG TPA: hypothetical protein VFD87_05150 [Phototrophicaceae bacterium]|nr:hypothetical protein [Phototrophicaceae bacterium]
MGDREGFVELTLANRQETTRTEGSFASAATKSFLQLLNKLAIPILAREAVVRGIWHSVCGYTLTVNRLKSESEN